MTDVIFFICTLALLVWSPYSLWKLCAKDIQIRELRRQLADCRYEKDTLEMHLKKAIDRIEELENRLTQR